MKKKKDPNGDNFDTGSVSSFDTTASMWSSFSVCTVGGNLRPRRRSPRNPFTGLAASKISCMNCGYTVSSYLNQDIGDTHVHIGSYKTSYL